MSAPKTQYAALPYRRVDRGIEIMLVTSRDTGRWVIPKGWPIAGLAPPASAAREAVEEAGIVGRIEERAIGVYNYGKRLGDGSIVPCAVEVFLLEVREQLESWPEKAERQTRWFSTADAANAVDEPELSRIIRDLPKG